MLCQLLQLMMFISAVGNTSRKVTIELLPMDVLIEIFDFYRLHPLIHSQLGERPWKWQTLAHVCKTWRSVLLASPHYLGLRLFFTNGMPVREILSSWPVLPIVIQYEEAPSSPLTPGDQDNIMALLELPTCLREVQLTVTTPLLEKMIALMLQPFSMLEYVHLSTPPGLVLPSKFGGGMSSLRALRMVGISLPALPQLLLSTHDLVSLQLEKVPSDGYTLEALIICLPTMTQLKTLHIHFLSPTSRPVLISTDQPLSGFSVLPVLNSIEFHGTVEYLESLLSGISAPLLEYFHIHFFNQLIFDTPQLSRFIRHTETQRSPTHATIQSSEADISITLTQLGVLHQLSLRISCKQLDWQIPSMAEVCDRLTPILADVEELKIGASVSFPDVQDDMDLIHFQILELFRPFRNVNRLCVTGASLSLVAGALGLVTGELAMAALPELQEIQTKKDAELASARTSLAPFIAARRRSTHPVVVCSTTPRRARFNEDPVTDVHMHPFSSPAPSLSALPPSPYPSVRHPLFYMPLPIPLYIAPAPIPLVYLHPMLVPPNLHYDMRYRPNESKSNPRLSPAVLVCPASSPPLPFLEIRFTGLPWHCIALPDPKLSPVVTVQDVLDCLYFHIRAPVSADEYNSMGKSRKAEIYRTFERRVGHYPALRGKGLRRVDFLGGQIIAQGLIYSQSQDNLWDLVVR
jgi:hypothetical protein